ncbi:YihY/virulence factor BrkB family protein [Actinotalea sp. Marseille-Q4924]|uniref:YihY/virulence factor BrkB family protein n=1 Tax=Actinotalea sp. Marseille-Q4924 TaxID=2866571 RepID=UPI001CE45105|nr:YihY/virulence factor BrkB family protein [Actinotalea sp. Marseille-Q4924]
MSRTSHDSSTGAARADGADGADRTQSHEGGTQVPSSQKAATAPHPDDERKPDSPDDIPKPGWKYTARKAFREFQRDQVTDLAAALTYWGVLAIAPTLLALVSLLGLFSNGQQTVERVVEFAEGRGMPQDSLDLVRSVITNLTSAQGAGLSFIIGLLLAIWSASGYVNAFSRAMNRIYQVDEGRPFYKLRPVLYGVTFVMLVLVAVIVGAMVLSGPVAEQVGGFIGLSSQAVLIWNIAKWPVIVLLVALVIAILYYATPNVKQPKFRWMSVGAFVAIIVWALATVGFVVYVTGFGGGENYAQTYGALAGVILFLLWIWITNNALLFGAEVDAELERSRELVAGIEAEETIQLPPRDTKASDKKQKQHEKDIAKGRELRLSAGHSDGENHSGDHDAERAARRERGDDDTQRASRRDRGDDDTAGAHRRVLSRRDIHRS